jgi:O-antigen/teichoic acid export membrane protein
VASFRIAPGLRDEALAAVPVAAAVYAVLTAQTFIASLLAGIQRMDVWNRIAAVTTLLQLAAAAVVLAMGGGLRALLLVSGATLVTGVAFGWIRLRQLVPEIGFDRRALARPRLLRAVTGYSAALQIINLGVLVQFQLDKVLFGSMISLAAVAHYEFGWRAMSGLWAIPALLLPPLLPAAAHLAAIGDHDRIVRLYHRASRYVLPIGFTVAAGMLALAPALYAAWLGPGHEGPALAARALALMLGVNLLTGVGTAIARGIGKPWLEVRYQVLAMLSHLVLSLTLIPRWGFAGGLVAMVLSTSVASLVFVGLFHAHLRDSVLHYATKVVARPAFAAIAGGAAAWAVAGAVSTALPDRADAAVRLGAGALVMAAVTIALLLATRHFEPGELRGFGGLGRGSGDAAAGRGAP